MEGAPLMEVTILHTHIFCISCQQKKHAAPFLSLDTLKVVWLNTDTVPL